MTDPGFEEISEIRKEFVLNREEKINKIKEIILNNIEVEAIVLFGSYAKKQERADSDIDIAIKPVKKTEKVELRKLQTIVEDAIDTDLHLINLNTIEEDFRYDILITGKTLYVKDEIAFWEYKFRAYSDYLELNEDRKIIVDKLMEGGTLYGKRASNNK